MTKCEWSYSILLLIAYYVLYCLKLYYSIRTVYTNILLLFRRKLGSFKKYVLQMLLCNYLKYSILISKIIFCCKIFLPYALPTTYWIFPRSGQTDNVREQSRKGLSGNTFGEKAADDGWKERGFTNLICSIESFK